MIPNAECSLQRNRKIVVDCSFGVLLFGWNHCADKQKAAKSTWTREKKDKIEQESLFSPHHL
jgi:hypothetical protein